MAKKQIIFRMTAFSAAAGKYNPEAPLDGNEDNFYVDDDLSDDILGRFQTNEYVDMSDCGCLMVVADGMGGMNAGEVASALAVDTVKDYFAPGRITPALAASPAERRKYLELVVKEADRRIKADAAADAAHEGMGSTIILAWIVGDRMTLCWCGDSRAYRYNPVNGLEPLSRDHSYVQELVNRGALAYEDTFEHPQGNIVTRSLGDPSSPARPESRQYEVYDQDVILLCSDGLSGVLRDRKTRDRDGAYYPGDNIEDIIAAHAASLTECRDALMDAAERAGWYDNVTVLLCCIESGAGKAPVRESRSDAFGTGMKSRFMLSRGRLIYAAVALAAVVGILCGVFFYLGTRKGGAAPDGAAPSSGADSILAAAGDAVTVTIGRAVEPEAVADEPAAGAVNPQKEPAPVKTASTAPDAVQSESDAAPDTDWRTELRGRLGKINEKMWKERVKLLSEEIATARDVRKNELGKRVSDWEKYARLLARVRTLQVDLSGEAKARAESLEKDLLALRIGIEQCEKAIKALETALPAVDHELTVVAKDDGQPDADSYQQYE
ncbi:MAG: protein phosphatase 2C domain-containing protein [Bacteroides sp.]|nr:protein phosphatase 2C domain-containing protein [Bacteroides sp.]MCM1094846.1 protein phosphatase 2C domain-containing protein [Terasakiella sp.]